MTEARFPLLSDAQMTPEQRRVAAAITHRRNTLRGPFSMLLRHPELAARVQHVGQFMRFENTLPSVVKELVVLVTARHWSAQFEWIAHKGFALEAGLPEAVCDAIAAGKKPAGLPAEQEAAYDFAAELLATKQVSDANFARAKTQFGESGVVELTVLVGFYCLISAVLNTDRTPIPEGATPLPALKA